jgi:organic hydroperoxide reductase OsmC/OhrA
MSKEHQYQVSTKWTGNLGTGTSQYKAYSRSHEISGRKKQAPIVGSSDPLFRGDATRYNPEELLVGALSACHMLWVLHLCADAGIVITEYSDEALGFMRENADGSAQFTGVTLRPVMIITDLARAADARAIHDRAHAVCALARSVNFPVHHEPVIAGASLSPVERRADG